MLLAELEIRHSRAVAPTRRVALGELWLPLEPPPGPGLLLLAAVVAACVAALDEESRDDLDVLIDDLERGQALAQPRLRHRFQTDVVGLDRSHHRLVRRDGDGTNGDGAMVLELDDHGAVLPQVLGAAYAAGKLSYRVRPQAFRLLRRASRWSGGNDEHLIPYLVGDEGPRASWRGPGKDEGWALVLLGFDPDSEPARSEIQQRFRRLLFSAHPDHGGSVEGAGERITDLTEAKRILLAEV